MRKSNQNCWLTRPVGIPCVGIWKEIIEFDGPGPIYPIQWLQITRRRGVNNIDFLCHLHWVYGRHESIQILVPDVCVSVIEIHSHSYDGMVSAVLSLLIPRYFNELDGLSVCVFFGNRFVKTVDIKTKPFWRPIHVRQNSSKKVWLFAQTWTRFPNELKSASSFTQQFILIIYSTQKHAIESHLSENRGLFSRVTERVDLPPNPRYSAFTKSPIEPPVPESHLIDNSWVMGGRLIIHTPSATNKLQLSWIQMSFELNEFWVSSLVFKSLFFKPLLTNHWTRLWIVWFCWLNQREKNDVSTAMNLRFVASNRDWITES